VPDAVLRDAKRMGISDSRLAEIWRTGGNGKSGTEKNRHLR
jgi:hypothetical protein